MIVWEPGMSLPTARTRNTSTVPSMVEELVDLEKALMGLDAADPDIDSTAFDQATDYVVAVARALICAAAPVLANPDALEAAVQDALADRLDLTAWCRSCDVDEAGLCGDHADNLAQADVYENSRELRQTGEGSQVAG